MENEPFVIERTYLAPAEKVWKAITEKEKMQQWYFDIKEFKPEVGCEFQFTAGNDEKKYLHRCKITEVHLGNKLAYSWRYDGYEGMSSVTFELSGEGTSTKVKLTHEGLETFPSNNPDFAKESFKEGWTFIIGTALKKFVEGTVSS
jgi:uncharacterized protein YndB with AHSA1/START domain